MPDKQCTEPTVHLFHTWCERLNPTSGMHDPGDNPLEWYDCAGVTADQVYHRLRPIFLTDDGDHLWTCSCGEKGTAAGQTTAQAAGDAHIELMKPKAPDDVMGGLFSQWRHKYHFLQHIGTDSKDAVIPGDRNECSLGDANLVSSEIAAGEHAGKHTVAIDLDVPAVLVASSTPGHSHLYIDVPMTWGAYERLLIALSAAGVVEPGYLAACRRRKHTSLRLPWIRKAPVPEPVVSLTNEPSPF